MRRRQSIAVRRGLTLLEVILAIAILGGALAVIGELIRLGSRSAAQARDLTTAQLYAESKLSAIAAGIDEPSAVSGEPLDDFGEWIYSVEPQEIDEQGMIAVRVTVMQDPEQVAKPVTFSLSRWILDPAVVEAAAAAEAEMKAKAQETLASAQSSQSAGASAAGSTAGTDPTSGGAGGAPQLPGGVGGPGGFGGFGAGGGPNGPGGENGPGGPGRDGPRGPGGPRGPNGPGGPGDFGAGDPQNGQRQDGQRQNGQGQNGQGQNGQGQNGGRRD